MQGIININKDAGMTSHDVVAILRGILKIKRIGHTGTLDPMATGVLPICIGKATRVAEFITAGDKTYRAHIFLGATSNTLDADGEIFASGAKIPPPDLIEKAVLSFVGEIRQIPPMYSAIKVGGKRLYSLARKGIEVERAPRAVTVHSIKILKIESECVVLDVSCSKGTYIRTLASDIGERLGCGAYLKKLVRTGSGGFKIEDSVSLSVLRALSEAEIINNHLIPIDALFPDYEKLTISGEDEKRVRNGAKIRCGAPEGKAFRVYSEGGKLLTLSVCEGGALKMLKGFY